MLLLLKLHLHLIGVHLKLILPVARLKLKIPPRSTSKQIIHSLFHRCKKSSITKHIHITKIIKTTSIRVLLLEIIVLALRHLVILIWIVWKGILEIIHPSTIVSIIYLLILLLVGISLNVTVVTIWLLTRLHVLAWVLVSHTIAKLEKIFTSIIVTHDVIITVEAKGYGAGVTLNLIQVAIEGYSQSAILDAKHVVIAIDCGNDLRILNKDEIVISHDIE